MNDIAPITSLPIPSGDRLHHEDVPVGERFRFGHKEVTAEEIKTFARAYDPQPIHLDEEAASRSIVGGLCASGFHSCAMLMRMLADDVLARTTSLGSPGIDEVKWLKPVRPGDVLSASMLCTEKRVLASRPEVGISKITFDMQNQKGETLMQWFSNQLFRVRHPEPAAASRQAEKKAPRPAASLRDIEPRLPVVRHANFFEDRKVGEYAEIGEHTFSKDDIVDFARQFDPQPFHLDEEAGKASLFGALSASGWQTAAVFIRQMVAFRQAIEAEIRASGERCAVYGPSPGFKSIRWTRPVLVGDTVSFVTRTSALVDLKSRPDRGLIVTDNEGYNQRGELVFAITSQILCERRKPYAAQQV